MLRVLWKIGEPVQFSPTSRIRPFLRARWTTPTNFLLRSFVSVSSAGRLYVFPLPTAHATSRKNNLRFAAIEREKGSSDRGRTNCTWQTQTCFVWSRRTGSDAHRSKLIRLNGDSSRLRDYLTVSSDLAMDQTSCSATEPLSVSRRMFLLLRLACSACEIRDGSNIYLSRDLAWNYYSVIKLRQSYLWQRC